MKVLIFTLMTVAIVHVTANGEAPVFTSSNAVTVDCESKEDQAIMVAQANAGYYSAISFSSQTNQDYAEIFEIDEISGVITVTQAVDYCNNRNQDFGIKITAMNLSNNQTTSMDVSVALRKRPVAIEMTAITEE